MMDRQSGEVPEHDDLGTGVDAGYGHEQPDHEGRHDLESAVASPYEEDFGNAHGSRSQIDSARAHEIIGAANLLDAASDEELEQVGLYRENQQIASYSGQLPPPEIFYSFTEQHQERMCRWVDSFTVDESRRQDKALNSAIKNSDRAQIFNFVFNGIIVVLTFAAFLVTGDPAAFLGFVVPGVSIISNVYVDTRGSQGDNHDG